MFQWTWLEQAIERRIIPAHADQFNSIHERLIEAWKKLGNGRHLHLAGMIENTEDAGTLAYLEDTARQAGLATTLIDIEDIGWRDDGGFVDLDNRDIELAFKLYPWEWMFHDAFGAQLAGSADALDRAAVEGHPVQQGHSCRCCGRCFPDHPNLLPAFFEDDPNAAQLGTSFVRKPLYSREGANVALISDGVAVRRAGGAVRRRRFHSPGARAAAEFFRPISGARKLAGRPHAVRAVDPRGRESDHRQYVAVFAARDPVEPESGTCGTRFSRKRSSDQRRACCDSASARGDHFQALRHCAGVRAPVRVVGR